jgi:hypothetical protein
MAYLCETKSQGSRTGWFWTFWTTMKSFLAFFLHAFSKEDGLLPACYQLGLSAVHILPCFPISKNWEQLVVFA